MLAASIIVVLKGKEKYKYYHLFSGQNDKKHSALAEYALSICQAQNQSNMNSTFITSNAVASSSPNCITINWGNQNDSELKKFIIEDSQKNGCKPIVVLHTYANPDIPVSADFLREFPTALHIHEYSVRPQNLKYDLLKYVEAANIVFVPQQSEIEDIIHTHRSLKQPTQLHERFARQLRKKAKHVHHPPLIDASEFIQEFPSRNKDLLFFGEIRFFKGLECMPFVAEKMKSDGRKALIHIAGNTSQERFFPYFLDIVSKVFSIPESLSATVDLEELSAFVDIVEGKNSVSLEDVIGGRVKGAKLLNSVINNKFGANYLTDYCGTLPELFESLRVLPIKFHQNASQEELAELVTSCGCGVALNERGIDNRNSVVPFLLFNSCPAICAKPETPLSELFDPNDANLLSESVAFVTSGVTARKSNEYPSRTAEEVYQQYSSICDHGVSFPDEANSMAAKAVNKMQEAGRVFTQSLSMDALVKKVNDAVLGIHNMRAR